MSEAPVVLDITTDTSGLISGAEYWKSVLKVEESDRIISIKPSGYVQAPAGLAMGVYPSIPTRPWGKTMNFDSSQWPFMKKWSDMELGDFINEDKLCLIQAKKIKGLEKKVAHLEEQLTRRKERTAIRNLSKMVDELGTGS